jgi:hypothetical protein
VEQDVGLTADERFISCFDPSDWNYLQEESTKNSDTKSNEDAVSKGKRGKAFRKEAKAFVKRIKSEARKKAGDKKTDSDYTKGVGIWKGKPKVFVPPGQEAPEKVCNLYMPPGYQCFVDPKMTRYQIRTPWGSCSRSYVYWGWESAVSQVANYAWEIYCLFNGFDVVNPHAWMRQYDWRLTKKDD